MSDRKRLEKLGLTVYRHPVFAPKSHVRWADIRRAVGDRYEAFMMFVNNREECRDGVFPDEAERVLGLIGLGGDE